VVFSMPVLIRRIDLFLIGLLVCGLPFMFHLNFILEWNVSCSDVLMVFIFIWLMSNRQNYTIIVTVVSKYKLIVLYSLFLIYCCIVSMVNYMTNIVVDIPYGLSSIVKLIINFLFIIVFLIFMEKYRGALLSHILRWWKYTAVVISFICIGSVILYRMGIDNGLTLDGRAQATLNDPNLAALYLIVSFSMIALSSIYLHKKLVINPSMIIVLVALFSTASRGGALSIVLGLAVVLFLCFLAGRIKELILFLCIVMICFCVLYWVNSTSDVIRFAIERVSTIGTEGDGTSYRIFLWKSAFEMWAENPFLGVGIGQYISYSPELFGYTLSNIPHNTYLSFLAETGLLGFSAFIWLPLYLLAKLVVGLISSGDKKYFYLLIGLIAVAVQAISINIENIRFIWLFIALIYVIVDYEPNRKQIAS
jgi:O-antigen ligase